MDNTRDILFALLRCGLGVGDGVNCGNFARLFSEDAALPDWNAVYKLSARQGVLAVAWDGLQRLVDEGVIPQERMPERAMMLQWVYNVQTIEERYGRQVKALSRLAGFYAKHGIDMMLLKGYGLSLCYPEPSHRPCGDIDVWLYGRQKEGDDLLRSKGVKVDVDKHHHTVFFVDGVMVENHFDFLNLYSHLSNRGLERILQSEAKERAESTDVDGAVVQLPTANFNALFLLRHAAGHYAAENIGLRHVADWAMFVLKYGGSVDWEQLRRTAEEFGFLRFLNCLNGVAVRCFGLDEKLFPQMEHDEFEERVLNDILCPEFAEAKPKKGFVKICIFKLRRWRANYWKHDLVYLGDGMVKTFVVQVYCHLLKPKSLTA